MKYALIVILSSLIANLAFAQEIKPLTLEDEYACSGITKVENLEIQDLSFIHCGFNNQILKLELHSGLGVSLLKIEQELYKKQLDNNETNPYLLSKCDLTTLTTNHIKITCTHGFYIWNSSESLKDMQHSELKKEQSLAPDSTNTVVPSSVIKDSIK